MFGILPREHFLEICKTFEKITQGLGIHLTFRTADSHSIVYTTLPAATVVSVHISDLYLFVPKLIPSPEIQSSFNYSVKNGFTLSFDSWTTDRRVCDTQLYFQLNFESAHKLESPKHSIAIHQTS